MLKIFRIFMFSVLFSILLIWTTGISGESKEKDYPTKPIELIVPFAPGAGTDRCARAVAGVATKKFGVPVNVINMPGASGVTGMMHALRAIPDGYTLLLNIAATSSFMWATRTDLPLSMEDRTFIGGALADYKYFFCNRGTGWKTLKDALNFAKAQPEKFKWGAGSYGSGPMFAQLQLFRAAGMNFSEIKKTKMVVFAKGNAPAMQACISGDVQFAVAMTHNIPSLNATKRVKILAVMSEKRTKEYADIPTTKELGYSQAVQITSYGICGPKGLPRNVIKVWSDMLKDGENDPEAQAAARKAKKFWVYISSDTYKANLVKEYKATLPIAEAFGLRK